MNNEWKQNTELPKDGDTIIAHVWCDFVVGWFIDRMEGVDYEEYVATYEPDDDDDQPVSRGDYEFSRYVVKPMYSSGGRTARWEDVLGWYPLPEVE